jgi:hypothetical protein
MPTHPTAGAAAANQFGVFTVHYATDRQVGYLRHLFESRNVVDAGSHADELREIYAQVATGKVSKKAASRAIDLLLPMPEYHYDTEESVAAHAAGVTVVKYPASDKQVGLIRRLADERDWADNVTIQAVLDGHPVEKRDASAAIDYLFACAKAAPKAAANGGPVEGMHFVDGRVIKVQRAVHGSGNLYAKVLVIDVEAADGKPAEAHFEYAPGVVNQTSVETLMTREDGAKFGRLYGMCVKCAATLTDEESIERGMGPICAGKGWAN